MDLTIEIGPTLDKLIRDALAPLGPPAPTESPAPAEPPPPPPPPAAPPAGV